MRTFARTLLVCSLALFAGACDDDETTEDPIMPGDPALAGQVLQVRIVEGLQTILKGEIVHE